MAETPAVHGLLLAGGRSRRMRRDKAALRLDGKAQLDRAHDLLGAVCGRVWLSVRGDQENDPLRARYPQIIDRHRDIGPAAGILAAFSEHPHVAWLVLACDLPLLDEATLAFLLGWRRPERIATAFRSSHDGLPEPLCAIWEPSSRWVLEADVAAGIHCPRKVLIRANAALVDPPRSAALDNMNRPEDLNDLPETLRPREGDAA